MGKFPSKGTGPHLRALGQGKTTGNVPKIFQVIDLDGDGFINFKEFINRKETIRVLFVHSMLMEMGKITAEELMEVSRQLGERCSLEDCRRMAWVVDADGDGLIWMSL